MTSKQLTERRKADREAMARAVSDLATLHHVACSRTDFDARTVHLDLELGDSLRVWVEFQGNSPHPGGDVFVLPWHLAPSCRQRLNPSAFDAQVNPHHGAKATLVRHGFKPLMDHLESVFVAFADGSAFAEKS